MSDNLMEKVSALGERLKIGGVEVGRKMTEGMTSMSFKVREFFQGPNQAEKLVEDATSEALDEPDWALNLDLCDLINTDKLSCVELIRGIKKRIMVKSPRIQYLALVLLETCVKNCEKAFSEVAAERVLDEIVRLIDDPQTVVNNRNKALMMVEAWGESTGELRYLPVFEETYKSLKSRGIRFPGRDNESLAPIFTPPRSVSAPEADVNLQQQFEQDIPEQFEHDVPVQSFSPEQTKEAFDVARNSIELLSTVLSAREKPKSSRNKSANWEIHKCCNSNTRSMKGKCKRFIHKLESGESMMTNPIWGSLCVIQRIKTWKKRSVYKYQLKIDELCNIVTAKLLQNIETLSDLT